MTSPPPDNRPRGNAVIEGQGLVREFGGGSQEQPVVALAGVDVVLRPGEIVGVSGPSGSGKTTLLHLLAGIDAPTRGEVWFEGRRLAGLSMAERARLRLQRVGLVFSEHNLSASLTAAENVDLPLALAGRDGPERARRVGAALDRLGVGALIGRFPESLSSGQQQRVAVARAIAGDPAVLIADEPTAHVDSVAGAALIALLAELVEERGMAVLVATHDTEVLARATRVLRLADGALQSADG